ncbi:MAG: Chemotaxis response regulator protein-glutamate methylesterase [Anaerolineales bacterium]|nr:pyridoxal-phosphate dependent enzyme [Anaerolineae bacterium]MBL8105279.1 pyridoxal-phosphate dependent enzyme [Anaerolineales bacterium]MBV6400553.1 Chemotaxis response regulator protein-glutamate methylesterase [Anaerolineales bacterium]MCC7187704.1 pyridoxal-phosphate dependent enzyme [Anaerolineales bacterium]
MSFVIRCLDCGHAAPFTPNSMQCPNCNSQWREAEYNLNEVNKTFPSELANRAFDLWRYRELLPIHHPNPTLRLGEGGTPLIQAANLGNMLGLPNLYIKDERQGPTSSFKDRQAAVTIATLKEAGITEMVAASTGNVAIAYSAYAARAGIKLWAFVTSLVPGVKMREIALYGSQVVKITGSYDQAKKIAAEFALQRGLYQDMGARTITAVEAMKTIAFEIAEQFTQLNGGSKDAKWKTPDWYIQAVSGGMGPLGVYKGFLELKKLGLIDRIPAIVPIQADGCAPMVDGWRKGLAKAEPVLSPSTRIETLATGDPGRTYTMLRERVIETRGIFESVSDEDAFRAMHVLAKLEGISAEPAAGVAFAGLFKLVRSGVIKPSDSVVVNCTGHTLPAEQFLFGDNWTRDVNLSEQFAQAETPQEGLLAALNNVTPSRFPRVAVVDDSGEARRLIRRILQSQGDFEIFEAVDGRDAINLINKEHPDIVILDLMMPEMDGFAVLDVLRGNPKTANIPVIVATAKELTVNEKSRLQGQIQSLMQKGDFLNDEFLQEVRALIG